MTLQRSAPSAGVPARVFRISFTGELSYEINVPATMRPSRSGSASWSAGAKYGITPYGTEAMHVLRAEKGFIIVGQETDGTVTPLDLGMGWIVARRRRTSSASARFSRADTAREDRKQLVGLLTEDPAEILPEGAQIIAERGRARRRCRCWGMSRRAISARTLGRSIAMALVKGGRQRMDGTVYAPLARPHRGLQDRQPRVL